MSEVQLVLVTDIILRFGLVGRDTLRLSCLLSVYNNSPLLQQLPSLPTLLERRCWSRREDKTKFITVNITLQS